MVFNKRYFYSACRILCAAIVLFAGTGCAPQKEDLTRFVPQDVNIIAVLDFQQLVRHKDFNTIEAVLQKYFNRLRKNKKTDTLISSLETSGLDLQRHLDTILFFSNFDPLPSVQRNANFPGLVIKTFGQSSKIIKVLQTDLDGRPTDTGKQSENGIPSYSFLDDESQEGIGAAVPNDDILVVARRDMLEKILAVYTGRKPGIAGNGRFMPILEKWENHRILRLSLLPEAFIPKGLRVGSLGVKVPKIFSLSFTVGGQETRISVNSPDEEGNQRFVNFFNGAKTIIGAVQTDREEEKMVVALYKNAQAVATPDSIEIVYQTSDIIAFITEILARTLSDKIIKYLR